MESNIHSNFIPHDNYGSTQRTRGTGVPVDIFTLLAIVLFVASATLAVGVFLYVQYLTTSSQSKLEQLERAKAAFEPALIQELTRLDDRMRTADELLAGHIAPSALFALLQQLTLQSVSFSTFDMTVGGDGVVKVTMQGLARSVNAIALQADYLSRSGVIVSPVFSNINRQRDGIRFDFEAEVAPSALSYRDAMIGIQNIPQASTPVENQQPSEPASPFGQPTQ